MGKMMQQMRWLGCALILALCAPAYGAEYRITLSNEGFAPTSLTVPFNAPFNLIVKNASDAVLQFESSSLARVKLLEVGQEAMIHIGPLEKGVYHYFNSKQREQTGVIEVQ